MKEKLRQFMIGRYGVDDLGRFLNILTLVLLLLGAFLLPQLSGLAMGLMIIYFFRMLSRNAYKRSQENEMYLRLKQKATGWTSIYVQQFKHRKTHKYFKCPSCKQTLRVPKGKGNISITCSKCRTVFKKRS